MFSQLLDAAPDAMVIIDGRGKIKLVNRMTVQTFGYPAEALIDQPIEMLIPEKFRTQHVNHRQHYFNEPRTRPMGSGFELTALRQDGSEFPVEISISPLETDEGILVTAVIRDITDRQQVQQSLRQQATELSRSNAELEQFAYIASHDLQEPLRTISSYAQLLERRYKDKLDTDANEFIEFIVDGASRMQYLINDLLTLSRVGTRGHEFKQTDLNKVVERVLQSLHRYLEENEASITYDALPSIMADESQLEQVLQNLIANAVKFHGENSPQVHIGIRYHDDVYELSISDNGIGFDTQFASRIFLAFQRLHSQREYPGTGIGLAICKKIVERHGGEIRVESEPGIGSTFYITLPKIKSETV